MSQPRQQQGYPATLTRPVKIKPLVKEESSLDLVCSRQQALVCATIGKGRWHCMWHNSFYSHLMKDWHTGMRKPGWTTPFRKCTDSSLATCLQLVTECVLRCRREQSRILLSAKANGTFLVRPKVPPTPMGIEEGTMHTHTVDLMWATRAENWFTFTTIIYFSLIIGTATALSESQFSRGQICALGLRNLMSLGLLGS